MELVARNPYQLQSVHLQMIEWCDKKIAEAHADGEQWQESIRIATERKWKIAQMKPKLLLAQKKVVFYTKIKAALGEGYYIVPNFDCSIFAIRTDRDSPSRFQKESNWPNNHKQSARMLSAGEGRYVSPDPKLYHASYEDKNAKGEPITKHCYWPSEFNEVEFPFDLAKPSVMSPASQAMATRIFDCFGIARNVRHGYQTKRGDPIILGIIKNPNPSRPDLSFFIAWAFDPETLD